MTNSVSLGNRLFFYGPPKIGLTTFAQQLTNVEFVSFNNPHLSQLKVKSCFVETMAEFKIWLKEACNNQTLSTYVFDHFDGFQDMIALDIALNAGVPNINRKEFGVGFFDAIVLFKKILKGLDMVIAKGHTVVILGHSTMIPFKVLAMDIQRFIPDCYIKNHKSEDVATILCNWVDGIFFVNGDDNRLCFSYPSDSFLAGNRLNLQPVFELDAQKIESAINYSKDIITIRNEDFQ